MESAPAASVTPLLPLRKSNFNKQYNITQTEREREALLRYPLISQAIDWIAVSHYVIVVPSHGN